MDLRKLKTLIDIVVRSGIAELEVTEGEERIRIVKGEALISAITREKRTAAVLPPPDELIEATEPSAAYKITSPMVGTFYRAPSPGAEPFVKIGDNVSKGQVLGIIEAMKLMNEIEADCDGIITHIPVANGQAVEYGQVLFGLDINEHEGH